MSIRVFRFHIPLPLVLLAAAEGVVFLAAPYLAVQWLGTPLSWQAAERSAMPLQASLFAGAMLLAMVAVGLYNPRQRFDFAAQLARLMAGVAGAVVLLAVAFFLLPDAAFGRRTLIVSALIAAAGAMLVRLVFTRTVDEDRFKRRILVFGTGRHAAVIAALRRRSDRRGFRLVGYLPAPGDAGAQVPPDQILERQGSLCEICRSLGVDEVVVAMDDRRQAFPIDELLECRLDGLEVTELVTFLERETGKVKLDVMNPSWMIFSDGFRRGRVHLTLERVFDLAAGLVLLILALPVMLVVAIAIKLEDGPAASVLYRQVRVGQFGRPFRLLKFRSMVENAERDGRAQWAQANDSRVTRVGSFIRKYRLDELPQVFNVLRGDMSFVGPRPERPEFVGELERKIPFYRERHTMKPGITGWAQLCYPYGASETDALEKLQYDLYYLKNHTLLFYLAILIQTVEVVIWRKGAR